MAAVDQFDRLLLGEVRVGDEDLVDRVEMALELLERAEVAQPVEQRDRRTRHEPIRLDLAAVAERVRDGLDVHAGAHEHRTPSVAGGTQDRTAELLEPPAERRHVDQREEERAVEDVVGLELLALEQREQEHDQCGLEQRGDHARQPGALSALAIEAGAPEQQQHHQPAERQVFERLVPHQAESFGAADRRLDDQRRVDGQQEPGEIERGERRDAHDGAAHVEAEQPAEQGLASPDVALGQR